MRIRLQDIAKDLNLSTMTISRVLRGQTQVSEETKARVLQRMQELKYRPNDFARSLRTGHAFCVGVLTPALSDPFWAAVCQGLATSFQEGGYGVSVSITKADPEHESTQIELQLSRQADALILIGPGGGKRLSGMPKRTDGGVPVICIGRKPDEGATGIGFNELEIGRMPAAYLLSRKACRIAYLRGPRTALADDRFRGFLAAHHEAAIAPHHEWAREIRSDDSEYKRAFDRVAALLRERVAPDAVMANTDALAAGARDAALAHGLRIPNDFQVVGCGNDGLLCSIGLPLTSVAFSGEELGGRAARVALHLLTSSDAAPSRSVLLSPAMAVRATTRNAESGVGGQPKRTKAQPRTP